MMFIAQNTRRAGLVLVLLFIVSLPAVTPRIYAADEIECFAYLRSLWFDHDLSFENEYRYFYDAGLARSPGFHETFLERATPTGRRENFSTIGCAILWAPFYGVADLAVRGLTALGYEVTADGYSRPYIAAVSYASALYGLLALLLSLHAVRFVVGDGADRLAGIGAVLAVWLGTPLLFYMYIAPPMSHAASAFAVAAFVVAWLHVRGRWSAGGVALLGALGALMGMVREQDLFFAGGPALDFLLSFLSSARGASQRHGPAGPAESGLRPPGPERLLVSALAGAAAFGICFLPQAISYLVVNGRLGPSTIVGRKMAWTAPHAFGVLASTEHGLLFWTPLAVLAIAGLFMLALGGGLGRDPAAQPARVGLCLLVMVALQVYIAGSVSSWTVAGAFGHRRFVGMTILLVIGLSVLLLRVRSRTLRGLVAAGVIACIWWNVALMVQFGSGMMDRQRLELGRNAYNAFITVPRELPGLAYRYFFARDSFYRWGEQGR